MLMRCMVVQMARYWRTCSMGMADSCGMAFTNAHIQDQLQCSLMGDEKAWKEGLHWQPAVVSIRLVLLRCAGTGRLGTHLHSTRVFRKGSNAPRDLPRLGHSNQALQAKFSCFGHSPSWLSHSS